MNDTITRTDEGYVIDGDAPMSPTEVLAAMSARGWHSTDITDALDDADARWARAGGTGASWREAHNTEVRRARDVM